MPKRLLMMFLLAIIFSFFCDKPQAKMFVRKEYTIDTERSYRFSDRWTSITGSEEKSLQELIRLLSTSKTGNKVLNLARKKANSYKLELKDVIKSGGGSLTDTTLIRRFSPDNPEDIVYESRSKVYINRSLTVKNAILDMAHELVHFSLREAFNPYKNDFGLRDFVVSTVEGKGGEVEAYLVECQVHIELFPSIESSCSKIVNNLTGRVDKELGITAFYQMGKYYSSFINSLLKHNLSTKDFTLTGKKRADFISSAYGLPYPLAAIHEYESIMLRVCSNDEKRLAIMKKNLTRAPAGLQERDYDKLLSGHDKKCRVFLARNQL